MKNRLSKILAASGVSSRRGSEELIFSGKVSVNGVVVRTPQTLVDTDSETIRICGKKIQPEAKKVYYMLNKPVGTICTPVKKELGAKRILDLFAHLPHRLFTAGRLDQQTSGLIVVTNDGHFANTIAHPSFNFSKEYLAKTEQEISFEHLLSLSEGLRIEGTFVKPLSVKKVRKGVIKITVSEGKKHEVRHLLAHAKLTVRELIRLRIGPLQLGNLQPGEYREISPVEIAAILKK